MALTANTENHPCAYTVDNLKRRPEETEAPHQLAPVRSQRFHLQPAECLQSHAGPHTMAALIWEVSVHQNG